MDSIKSIKRGADLWSRPSNWSRRFTANDPTSDWPRHTVQCHCFVPIFLLYPLLFVRLSRFLREKCCVQSMLLIVFGFKRLSALEKYGNRFLKRNNGAKKLGHGFMLSWWRHHRLWLFLGSVNHARKDAQPHSINNYNSASVLPDRNFWTLIWIKTIKIKHSFNPNRISTTSQAQFVVASDRNPQGTNTRLCAKKTKCKYCVND